MPGDFNPPEEREDEHESDVEDRRFKEAVHECMRVNGYTEAQARAVVAEEWFGAPPAPEPFPANEITSVGTKASSMDEISVEDWDNATFALAFDRWVRLNRDNMAELVRVRDVIDEAVTEHLLREKEMARQRGIAFTGPRETRSDKGKKRGPRT